jgi:uncharacterized protein
MLVSLSVSNFRSFSAEQTFSMVASKRIADEHKNHLISLPGSDENVLRTAVLYGANGAGKSNLFKALRYVKTVALASRRSGRGTDRDPFRLADIRDQPSTFDLQFVAADSFYRFGFSIDDERILEEWLIRLDGNKENTIYERRTDSNGQVTIEAPALKRENNKLSALVTVGGPHNQSFLATVRTTLEPQDVGKTLTEVMAWLDTGLTLIGPTSNPDRLAQRLATDSEFLDFSSSFLSASSTGIDRIKVDKREIPLEEIDAPLSRVMRSLLRSHASSQPVRWDGADLVLEKTDGRERFYRIAIQAMHKLETNNEVTFELPEESDGTQRLLSLTPALHSMRRGSAVFVIDEIDRSMHPMLVYKFIEYFLNALEGPSQVIVTTHETHLLTLDLLRRDEIWFAEKDRTSATNLYSLTDFKVRNDLRIRNGYLDGRFGAIPFLGDIDSLIESRAECP